jgi:hypothetical protein
MTKTEHVIADLINALGAIQRTALSDNSPACMRVYGISQQALANVESRLERNTDGYKVKVKE